MDLTATMRLIQKNYNTSTGKRDDNHCPKCRDRGDYMEIFWQEGIPYETLKKCECSGVIENERRLKNSGLSNMRSFVFDNFYADSPWQVNMKNLAMENASIREWFFVGGSVGSGKTHICSAICNYIIKHGGQVKYSIWVDDIRDLKRSQMDQNFKEKINKLKTVDTLYIDDLFKARKEVSASDLELTYEILNYRYLNGLKTIISSERNIPEILAIDEAIGSRIQQKCKKYAIDIAKSPGRNYRLKKNELPAS